VCRRTFREASNKLIEKFLGADLKVEGISTVLNAYIEEL
jgi:hypothetical protein